jgi:hypothetical protein
MAERVLDGRGRNRALLARQLLLQRAAVAPLAALERLIGLQAQTPRSPYTALWSRLRGFDPMVLSRAIENRRAVRIALMRSTIHLVTARDALRLRPLIQPVVMRELTVPTWRVPLEGVDRDALAIEARRLLEHQPRTPAQLGAALAETWPDRDPRALAHAARSLLPLVQIPPRGLWDRSGATTLTTAEHWLGAPIVADASWDDLVLRYLAAFGPATAADLVAWCKVTGLGPVVERVRPRLRVLHDPDGRELFDLPRAPRPPASTPAPPRFLPDFDNVLLSHADRNHVFADAYRRGMQTANGTLPGTVLVDGSVAATWQVRRSERGAELLIDCLDVPRSAHAEIRDEGLELLHLLAPEAAAHDMVLREA